MRILYLLENYFIKYRGFALCHCEEQSDEIVSLGLLHSPAAARSLAMRQDII